MSALLIDIATLGAFERKAVWLSVIVGERQADEDVLMIDPANLAEADIEPLSSALAAAFTPSPCNARGGLA